MLKKVCTSEDTSMFYSEGLEDKAIRLCMICPVMDECLLYATSHHEKYGVWGGTSPKERNSMLAKSLIQKRDIRTLRTSVRRIQAEHEVSLHPKSQFNSHFSCITFSSISTKSVPIRLSTSSLLSCIKFPSSNTVPDFNLSSSTH